MKKKLIIASVLLMSASAWAGDLTVDRLTVNSNAVFNASVTVSAPNGDIPMGIFTNKPPSPLPWNPLDIPGCIAWYDAGQIAGLNDGNPVTQWPDMSTLNHHANQADPVWKPTYKTNIIGGKPVIRFAGHHQLTIPYDEDWSTDDTITIVCVTSFATGAYWNRAMISTKHNGDNKGWCWECANADQNWHFYKIKNGNYWENWFGTSSGDTFYVLTVKLSLAGYQFRRNGAIDQSGACTGFTHSAANPFIGEHASFPGNPDRCYRGDIAEIIIYNNYISDSDQAGLEAYLAAKYGL